MSRKLFCSIALLAAALPTLAMGASKSQGVMLSFSNMEAVNGRFVTPQGMEDPNIRGIPGDSQAWKINKHVKGKVFGNGRLVIKVQGLVHDDDTPINDSTVRAAVSCLNAVEDPLDSNNSVIEPENFITKAFPISPEGKANIKAKLQFQGACVAPLVMILNGDDTNGDVWYAVTGFTSAGGNN